MVLRVSLCMRVSIKGSSRIFQKLHILCESYLRKSVNFILIESCLKAFGKFKEQLVSAPIIISPDWSKPFEVMCDASGVALGIVLGQKRDNIIHPIYYASKALNDAQKELHCH